MDFLQKNFFNFGGRDESVFVHMNNYIIFVPIISIFFLILNYIICDIIFSKFLFTEIYLKLTKKEKEDWNSR
jgi:hypothetical protein